MRNPTRCLVMVGLLGLTIACAPRPQGLTDARKTAVVDSTKAVLAGVIADVDKLDFDAALKPFSSDADARCTGNGALYPSLEAMRKAFADMKPILDSLTSTVDAWDIVSPSDDAATFTLPMHPRRIA
jgi:hypothetical protein